MGERGSRLGESESGERRAEQRGRRQGAAETEKNSEKDRRRAGEVDERDKEGRSEVGARTCAGLSSEAAGIAMLASSANMMTALGNPRLLGIKLYSLIAGTIELVSDVPMRGRRKASTC